MIFSLHPDDRKRIDRALDLFEKYLALIRDERHNQRVRQIRGLS